MYGAVLFDDEKDNGPGWASFVGGRPFRFKHPYDLQTDAFTGIVCWWTNSTSQWSRGHGILKPHDYLRPAMSSLRAELGLAHQSPATVVAVIAEIFGRVMGMARDRYGMNPGADLTLIHELSRTLYPKERRSEPAAVNAALRDAYQTVVICAKGKVSEQASVYELNLPRLPRAIAILNTPIPNDYWNFIPGKNMPPEGARVEWLLNERKPVIARARVSNVHPAISRLVKYSGDDDELCWLTHPELLMMSRFADIKIHDAYLGGQYSNAKLHRPFVVDAPFEGLSLSGGILACNYAGALSTPQEQVFGAGDNDFEVIYSPRTLWLSATDRILTLTAALVMHAAGFIVRSYGLGVVTVESPVDDIPELCATALLAGLEVPLGLNRMHAAFDAISE